MRHIINDIQATYLALLAKSADKLTRNQLLEMSGTYNSMYTRNVPDLVEAGLVSAVKGSHSTKLHSITAAGRKALADHAAHQAALEALGRKALPARRNLFEFATYTPTTVHHRNSGNHQIPSRGVRC